MWGYIKVNRKNGEWNTAGWIHLESSDLFV